MFHDFLSLRTTRSVHFATLGIRNRSQAHEKLKDRAKNSVFENQKVKGE